MQLLVIQFTIKIYYQQLHLKYLCNLQGINYELPDDDTIVSKHVGV